MKKLFVLFLLPLLFLSFIPPVNAQVKIGVQAGANFTEAAMDKEIFNTALRTRTIIGGIISYDFLPLLSLQTEPAYVQKGVKVDAAIDLVNILNGAANGTISANYFEIPVLLKLTIPSVIIKPYLLAGGSVAFLLGDPKLTVDKVIFNGQDITTNLPSDIKEQPFKIKNTDLILCLGGGITIPIGLLSLFAEARYDLGLTDVSDGPYSFDLGITTLSYDTEFKTRGFQLKAGILVGL